MPQPLKLCVFLLACIFLLIGFFHPSTAFDQDLGRHLLNGKMITQTLHVPTVNLFSYTYPTFTFINHHWFSEVIFYNISTLTGTSGLFIFSLILILSAWGILSYSTIRHSYPLIFLALSVVYLRILFERTEIRPELFSFLFLAIIVTILYQYREKYTPLIFLLIPLELFWANMHIYFPIGVLVTLLFVIDNLITHRKNLFNPRTKILVTIFIFMGLATLLNPHGLSGATYPLRVFQNYGYTIEENQNPFFLISLGFTKPSLLYLEIAVGVTLLAFLSQLKKTFIIDWLLFVVFSIIAFNAVRNFPLFVFATFIPTTRLSTSLFSSFLQFFTPSRRLVVTRIGYFLLVLFVFWQTRTVIGLHEVGFGVSENAKSALDFFQTEKLHGPIFNNFDIGSYMEYRLYPGEKVFIDGRPEAYPASFIQNTYIKMQEDPKLFKAVSNHYHFNSIVFAHTDQTPWAESFLRNIVHDSDWIMIYLDPTMVILVRNSAQNQSLIKRFGKSIDEYSLLPPSDKKRLQTLGHFYGVVGFSKQLEETLLRLLAIEPNNCNTLTILTQFYTNQNNPAANLYAQRSQAACH